MKPTMKPKQGHKQSVTLFQTIAERLAEKPLTKTKPFFLALILGTRFAIARRRTVPNGSKPRKSVTNSDSSV